MLFMFRYTVPYALILKTHNSNDFYYKDYKAWCEMRGVSVTSEIKRFVMEELDRLHEEEMKK